MTDSVYSRFSQLCAERTVHYINRYTDEASGVCGTLHEIALTLAQGNPDDQVLPAAEGMSFKATRIHYAYIQCSRREDGTYAIPDDLPGTIFAIAFGIGLGWSPDSLVNDREEAAQQLEQYGTEEIEHLACRCREDYGTITFRVADGAPICVWTDGILNGAS